MSDHPLKAAPDSPPAGARLATLGGLAAAFGVASCCALPLLLTTLGLSATWLAGVALVAAPHRTLLMAVAAAGLLGGAFLLWRQRRGSKACDAGATCAPRGTPWFTLTGLVIGAGLLLAGFVYA